MDYFALSGILIDEENIGSLIASYREFTKKWNITAPLHSTRIRGRRKAFTWLGRDAKKEQEFLGELETFIIGLPITSIACVIDRPGYVRRYTERYIKPWLLCKTAFGILIERAAKYASSLGARLDIYFEQAGEQEDRDIQSYARALKNEGMPFDAVSSGVYQGFRPDDFKSIVIGEPNRVTKQVPMMQVADLVLYPMVKGGYDQKAIAPIRS